MSKVVVPICTNMKLSDAILSRIVDHNNGRYHLDIGIHTINFRWDGTDVFYAEYNLYWQNEEYITGNYYTDNLTGLYNAVWEFICTLDKWCSEESYRRLGSAFEAGFPH